MATNPPTRPPWETSSWRSFHQPPLAVAPAKPAKSIGVLGVLAIAVGAGVFGYYMLDGHTHTCEACSHRWRHLGAFNMGDAGAHTCKQCGTVQWWKDGFQQVFRDPSRVPASALVPAGSAPQQEIRGVLQSDLPSLAFAGSPRGILR